MPHLDAAYNFARWLTGNNSDARDVVHDAWLRALRSFAGFRGGDMRPWLFAIIRNCFLTRRQRQGNIEHREAIDIDALDADAEPADAGLGPDEWLMRQQTRAAIDGALERLPGAYREVIVLRELEELSYNEIAQVTGIPLGTVMSRLARARRALLILLAGEAGLPP